MSAAPPHHPPPPAYPPSQQLHTPTESSQNQPLVTGLATRRCGKLLPRPSDQPPRSTSVERLVLVEAAPAETPLWTLRLPHQEHSLQLQSFTATLTPTLVYCLNNAGRNSLFTFSMFENSNLDTTVHINESSPFVEHLSSHMWLVIWRKPAPKFQFIICIPPVI